MTDINVRPGTGSEPGSRFDFTANPNRPKNPGIGYGVPGAGKGVGPVEPLRWGGVNWTAVGLHFVTVAGVVWWVTKRPVAAMATGAVVAWALDTDTAKDLFKH